MALVPVKKNPTFNHIIDNLYLGDINAVDESIISKENIRIVVNISNSRYNELNDVEYYHIDIDDNRNVNISDKFSWFVNLVKTNSTKNILVHCMCGVSRSVTLVLAYLMNTNKDLKTSFDLLKSKRTQYTKPNRGFAKQLIEYEKSIFVTNSIKITDFNT